MDTQDGFIVGIYNYCDRWCEHCSLNARCRVFAEEQRLSCDRQSEPDQGWAPALRSLGALAASGTADQDDLLQLPLQEAAPRLAPWPDLPPAEVDLHHRVSDLGRRLSAWIAPESRAKDPAVIDAVDVLQHFGIFIGPKTYRALTGRTVGEADGPRSDAVGSAKAALLAFDRLGEAWLRLAEHGAISVLEAAPVLTELQRVSVELDTLFPRARDFVRPGFDEPAAVAMLEWRERG